MRDESFYARLSSLTSFSLVELSIVLVKKAMSFSGLTRESRQDDNKILASSARMTTSGFSLVELSIVLVILGLLTGGILTGQNLIRAAELRSVISEMQEIETAYNLFKGRYRALPGDMRSQEAYKFWQGMEYCPSPSACGSGGDGNGWIANYHGSGGGLEFTGVWAHLYYANLYRPAFVRTSFINSAFGFPKAALGSSTFYRLQNCTGWLTTNVVGCQTNKVYGRSGHYLWLAGLHTLGAPHSGGISPVDVYSIDAKVDDGVTSSGKIVGSESHYQAGGNKTFNCTVDDEFPYNITATKLDLITNPDLPVCNLGWKLD